MQDERILFKLSETAAIGSDDLQWILYRATGRKTRRPNRPLDGWQGISFVRSTKVILLRCVREKGLEVSPEGWKLLAALPDTFDGWKSACSGECPTPPISDVAEGSGPLPLPEGPDAGVPAVATAVLEAA
jgi:hypothetical protein